jgi:hypothetical protein
MLPYSYTNLLGEVLFGQMLALPRPRLPAMAYCTIMVDLCKVCEWRVQSASLTQTAVLVMAYFTIWWICAKCASGVQSACLTSTADLSHGLLHLHGGPVQCVRVACAERLINTNCCVSAMACSLSTELMPHFFLRVCSFHGWSSPRPYQVVCVSALRACPSWTRSYAHAC